MEVARTSMIHAAAPHFLWPFAVRYAAHQLNLWPRVSLPETSPTLCWTGEVGDASVFRFYHPTSRHVFPSQDVTFDKSVPFYRLFPYRSAPPPPPPLFLAPGPPPVDPLPPLGPAPSGVSQVDPLPGPAPVQVVVGSGAARGVASWGAESGGAEPGGAEPGGAEPGDAESEGAESGGAEPRGVGTGGAEPEGVEPGGTPSEGGESGGAEPQGAASSGATGVRGAGGTGVVAGVGGTGGAAATGPGGTRTRGTGAAGTGGVEGARAGDLTESGASGAGGARAGGAGVGGAGAGGAGAAGAGVGGTGAAGTGAVDLGAGGAGGTVRPRPYFIPLLQQVLVPPSSTGPSPFLCPLPNQSQPPLQPASQLPPPSPYTEQSSGLTERRKPASHPVSPVRTARRAPCSRPPPVPGTHVMTLRPSSVPLFVPLPAPLASSLPEVPDSESDRARAASPTVSRLLATAITDPSFESAAASALVAELLDFAAACRLDYATALVAESASACPPSVGGECALGTNVLEDRQEDFECLAAAVPRFASMLLASEGDSDAPDIPTPHSYAEAITGPYSSQWQAAMDAEMASWKSTGTYVDEVPPPGANIVDGMWIFRGVDYFQTFFPTPKMTTLWVLLHVAAQHDYELHSLDFSTAFLQGSLHEEIWLRRPPGFTGTFPGRTTLAALGFAPSTADPSLFLRTDTSLPPFYILVYVDNLVFATADNEALTLVKSELQKRHTCTDLGPSALWLPVLLATAHSSVYQPLALSSIFGRVRRAEWSVPRACGLPRVPDMTCTRPDLVYPLSLLARYVAPGRHRKVHWDAAKRLLRYLCSTSGMGLVLGGRGPIVLTDHADASWVDDSATQRSSQGYTFSLGSGSVSWRSTRSSSVLNSSCEAKIYAGAMAAQELRWLTYLLTDLGEQPRSPPVLTKHIAMRYFLARELHQRGQLRLAYVATRANTADVFTKALAPACFAFLDWSCDHLFSPTLPMGWAVRWGATTGGTCDSTLAGSVASRCRGSGGGQKEQQRPLETLSPQQLCEWAVRWGSPGGGGFRAPVLVTLADPSGGPVVARGATVLPCPAAPSGLLIGLHLPSFAKNLVATSVLQDQWITVTQPVSELVAICTDSRTSEHLATFTRRPGSGPYTLTTEPALVAESGQVAAFVEVVASCSCRLLMHQTLLWHHHLGHPSLPRLRGMHSRLLVSGLPRSLPLLPRSLASPFLPCAEGRQRAAPHSSSLPPTTAPLQTLHMDVWGPARVTGQGGERYFLLVVDDYTRYTTVFPLQSRADVRGVLIRWIRAVRLQLRTRFREDLPVLRLQSDRGGEFCSRLLEDFCGAEGILHSYTLPASPEQNGIAERRIGLVMEVSRTSMIHAAAPYFLWTFAVQYAADQLNLWPCVSHPETSPTLRWTGEVGDVSVFRVWDSLSLVCDLPAGKLSPRTLRCVFLGFPTDAPS
ncbi:unnamed protein product [Closterium sp. NIES-53]